MTPMRQALCWSLGLLAACGVARGPSTSTGLAPEALWVYKVSWGPVFSLVVAGDSRVYRGVAPLMMQEVLPQARIANFGFSGCAFTAPYFEAVEALWAPAVTRPLVILGITPHALTPAAAAANDFATYAQLPPWERLLRIHAGSLLRQFAPYTPEDLRRLAGRSSTTYHERYTLEGWVASRKVPEDPTVAVRVYAKQLAVEQAQRRVSEAIVGGLLEQTRRWHARGVGVYGFRPPTTEAMEALERRGMGFDEGAFVSRFEAEGGLWLALPKARYATYDGSHLREESALQLSRDLATAIAQREAALDGALR